ncbi:hypothetical protein D9615_008445 [Tricholomella constricta]|uniref:Uncharacterized protein n=1 Tax=Tricholomella constricta TaxID=117010 RepID=A0A8H5M0H3_9AGAR|nr:hypothetical protein D9615_008445 [Tricholomella constricta]
MPSRSTKHARASKSSRAPVILNPDPPRLPIYETEPEPEPEPEDEQDDSGPPIPIPVPRSQTPQLPHPVSRSGIARTIPTSHSPTKRFTAPLPLPAPPSARAAPAVVDLGTVPRTCGPNPNNEDHILWARWDTLPLGAGPHRRLLFVAYPSVLQIYDTTDLGALEEVLRLPLASLHDATHPEQMLGCLVHAAALPSRLGQDEEAPLIGLAFDTGSFLVYSLKTHRTLTHRHLAAPIHSFQANEHYIVVSTTAPRALHVLATRTLAPLHVVPAPRLAAYRPPPPPGEGVVGSAAAMLSSAFAGLARAPGGAGPRYNAHSRFGSREDGCSHSHHYHHHEDEEVLRDADGMHRSHAHAQAHVSPPTTVLASKPHAVYALSHRLLAYISPSPSSPRSPASSSLSPAAPPSTSTSSPTFPSGTTTAPDTGAHAELRRVWGGVRTLGGMAVSAARARVGGGGGVETGAGAGVGRFFSRSAPEGRGFGMSMGLERGREREGEGEGEEREGGKGGGGGSVVTVVDLGGGGGMDVVVEFSARGGGGGGEEEMEVARLEWAPDGCALGVVPRDGQAVRVFQVRPVARSLSARTGASARANSHSHSRSQSSSSSSSHPGGGVDYGASSGHTKPEYGSAWHVYSLRRGWTSAVVEGVAWTSDGRWAAVGSKNRTVHVFAVDPPSLCGGGGRAARAMDVRPMMTEMNPLVRLRAPTPSTTSTSTAITSPTTTTTTTTSTTTTTAAAAAQATPRPRAALAFTFISSGSGPPLPSHLRPSPSPSSLPPSSPPSYRTPTSGAGSGGGARTDIQDILVFDPGDASLALRRVVLEVRPRQRRGGKEFLANGGMAGMGMGMGIVSGAAAAVMGMGMGMGMGATSISLPVPGRLAFGGQSQSQSPTGGGGAGAGFGRRSSSRSRSRLGQAGVEEEVQMQMELVPRESTVMVWSLRIRIREDRGEGESESESGEVRKVMDGPPLKASSWGRGKAHRADNWLAQAELSTSSKSQKVVPRSIYLSHQFSFHTLGEDYHALIRRYRFEDVGVGGHTIEARRQVQVSAYAHAYEGEGGGGGGSGGGGEFVEASPRHRSLSASFDAPLASALINDLELEHAHVHGAGVLPMYPNGGGGAGSASSGGGVFRSAMIIPIRARTRGIGIGEGVGGIIRREIIKKVRSPRVRPRSGSSGESESVAVSVPLEFDEEDEDFMLGSGEGARARAREGEVEGESALEVEVEVDDAWGGWSVEDGLAVEEAERFDDIDVLGLLDEEQALARQTQMKRKGRQRRSRA